MLSSTNWLNMLKGYIPFQVIDNSSEEDKEKLLKENEVIADDKYKQFIVIRKPIHELRSCV